MFQSSVEMYEVNEINYTVVGIFNDSNRAALYFSHDELLHASGNQTLSLSASSEITAERLFKATNIPLIIKIANMSLPLRPKFISFLKAIQKLFFKRNQTSYAFPSLYDPRHYHQML